MNCGMGLICSLMCKREACIRTGYRECASDFFQTIGRSFTLCWKPLQLFPVGIAHSDLGAEVKQVLPATLIRSPQQFVLIQLQDGLGDGQFHSKCWQLQSLRCSLSRGDAWCYSTCLLCYMRWRKANLGVIHGTVLHVLDGQLDPKSWQLQSRRRPQLQTGALRAATAAQQCRPVDVCKLVPSCAHVHRKLMHCCLFISSTETYVILVHTCPRLLKMQVTEKADCRDC